MIFSSIRSSQSLEFRSTLPPLHPGPWAQSIDSSSRSLSFIIIIIIIIVSIITVFAGVLFVHQPGANHAPRASVTQINHSSFIIIIIIIINIYLFVFVFIVVVVFVTKWSKLYKAFAYGLSLTLTIGHFNSYGWKRGWS